LVVAESVNFVQFFSSTMSMSLHWICQKISPGRALPRHTLVVEATQNYRKRNLTAPKCD